MKIGQYLREVASYISAAWLLPNGKILDCGSLSHISFILKSPQKFGFTDADIKGISYQDPNKPNKGITTYTDGVEDKAWDKIISSLLERGFIRIRKVKINKYSYLWYIDIREFNRRTQKILSDWAYSMKKEKDDRVIVSVAKGDSPDITNMGDLYNLVEEHEQLQIITLDEMIDLV